MNDFFSPVLDDVQFNQDGSLKQSGRQMVKFYPKKRLASRAKKDEAGNIIIDPKTGQPKQEAYEETVLMVRVETKGDTNIKDDVANEADKRQFFPQYRRYMKGGYTDGTPIEEFEFIQPASVMELHMLGVHVIEQVADMSDLVCEQLRAQSGYELRDVAMQWREMNTPKGQSAKVSQLEKELQEANRKLLELQSGSLAPKNIKRIVEESVIEEPAIETLDMSPEEFAKKRKK